MKISLVIVILVMVGVLLSRASEVVEKKEKENRLRWDVLEAISSRIRGIKQRDVYLFHMWALYKSSSRFEKPKLIQEVHDALTKLAYLDSRINMLGLILFGPINGPSILRAVRDKKLPMADDQQCLISTLKLFEKHCGVLTEHDMKQSLANICNYVAEKVAIKEAIIIACRMHRTESHGIDVGNPKIDVTPSPIHGTFQYCGRVSVNGVSRMKLPNFAKTYKVMVVPSKTILDRWHNLIRICFHKNDSQGLCQCEEDDWKSVQKGSWSSVMSPYEQRFLDVKFVVRLEGFVTVTLDEVSHFWRNGLLIGGIALLFMAGSKNILAEVVDDHVSQFVKWAMRVLAVACIFMSSVDTPLALVAVCSCLVLYYVITSIIGRALISSKRTTLWPRNGLGQGTVDDGGGIFHRVIKNTNGIKPPHED